MSSPFTPSTVPSHSSHTVGTNRDTVREDPYFVWNRVADIPDIHDGNNGRLIDTTVANMPPGVKSVIKVTVTDAPDSSVSGDAAYGSTGHAEPWITEGSESWITFWHCIPLGWRHSVISSGWNTFAEFHETGGIAPYSTHIGAWGSDPPVWQLACFGGDIASPTGVWVRDTQPLETGRFQRHVIHTRWSTGSDGYYEWWIDGRPVVTRTSKNVVASWGGPALADSYPTFWAGAPAPHFQIGHYRGPSRPDIDVTYLADVRCGPTLRAVGRPLKT